MFYYISSFSETLYYVSSGLENIYYTSSLPNLGWSFSLEAQSSGLRGRTAPRSGSSESLIQDEDLGNHLISVGLVVAERHERWQLYLMDFVFRGRCCKN